MGKAFELDFTEPKSTKSDPEDIKMTFGKHRGEKLGDLPNTYLRWCIDNLDDEKPWMAALLDSMQKVLDGRYEYVPDEFELESGNY